MSQKEAKRSQLPSLSPRKRAKFVKILNRIESEDYSTPTAAEGHKDALSELIVDCFLKDDPKYWGQVPSLSEAIDRISEIYEVKDDLKKTLADLESAVESYEEETEDAYHIEYEDWGYPDDEAKEELIDAITCFVKAFSNFLNRVQ